MIILCKINETIKLSGVDFMNGLLIIALSIMVLGVAYLIYGRWIAKTWELMKMLLHQLIQKKMGRLYSYI